MMREKIVSVIVTDTPEGKGTPELKLTLNILDFSVKFE